MAQLQFRGVVIWHRASGKSEEHGIVAVRLRRLLFVNGLKRCRLDKICSVARGQDGAVLLTWPNGDHCSISVWDRQYRAEAEDLAELCRAAADCRPAQSAETVAAPVPGKAAEPAPSLLCSGLPRQLGRQWQAPVVDFGGRMAELLWSPQARAEITEHGLKRRRLAHEPALWRLLEVSYSVRNTIILGVKERRPFVQDVLAYDAICQEVKERFPVVWRRLRPLQASITDEQDKQVALSVIEMHRNAEISMGLVKGGA